MRYMSGGVMAEGLLIVASIACLILASTATTTTTPTTSEECDVDGLRCCATEFYPLITAKSGFSLDEESINKSCSVLDPTFNCLTDYEEQCMQFVKGDDMLIINEVKSFLTDLCSPGSKLSNDIDQSRQCIMATSKKLQSCASKKDFRSDNPWSKPCCEYSMLKACAQATIEENCGDEVMVLVRNLVEKIDGIGYETVCKDYYDTCGNSATTVLTTTLVLLISVVRALLGSTL